MLWNLESCCYYKWEDECPFPMSSIEATYWEIEELWVKLVNSDVERHNFHVYMDSFYR